MALAERQQQQQLVVVVVETPPTSPSTEKPRRRRRSRPSWLLPFAKHLTSSGTAATSAAVDSEEGSISSRSALGDSSRSSTPQQQQQEAVVQGILKIRTHAHSLAIAYPHHHHPKKHASHDESAPPIPSTARPTVTFGTIDVLIFPIILGDNPSVSVGPPIAMGGTLAARMSSVGVEAYESARPPRRYTQQLAIPKMMREDWLRDEGVSRGQWRQAEEQVLDIQKSRKASLPRHNNRLPSKFFLRLFASSSSSSSSSSNTATSSTRRTSTLRK